MASTLQLAVINIQLNAYTTCMLVDLGASDLLTTLLSCDPHYSRM